LITKPERKRPLVELGIDERMILNCTSKNYVGNTITTNFLESGS
jgi:hypothetical protein